MVATSNVSGDMPERRKSTRSDSTKAATRKKGQVAKKVYIKVKNRQFFRSANLSASVRPGGSVGVDVSVKAADTDLELFVQAFREYKAEGEGDTGGLSSKGIQHALREAAAQMLKKALGSEIEAITASYRTMLAGSLATEPNPVVAAAMNQARLQARILEGAAMLDQSQACEVLGLSKANPSATMNRKEERLEVLRFTVEGRAVYPLFQFDVSGRRIYPAMTAILKAKPKDWSDFRVMHWLTRPHVDLGGTPADVLGAAAAEVEAAFQREIKPVTHG